MKEFLKAYLEEGGLEAAIVAVQKKIFFISFVEFLFPPRICVCNMKNNKNNEIKIT